MDVKRMAFRTILYLLCCFIFLLTGCAATHHEISVSALEDVTPNPVWPPAPQKPRIQYLRSIAGSGETGLKKSWLKKTLDAVFGQEEGQEMMLNPYGICVHAGKIYVSDPGYRVLHVYNMEDSEYFQIKGTKNEYLESPVGVAVDQNGEIYLSDSGLRRVFVFNQKGGLLREIGPDKLLIRPAGIAIDGNRLYVIDTHGHCALVFNKEDGRLLFTFGKRGSEKGNFNYPTNIFVDKAGLLYITDSMNFRVEVFDRDGKFISEFGRYGDGSGDFSKPKGVAVDSDGNIYVVDAQFDNVQIFNKGGQLLLGFGKTGRRKGEMLLPSGIFIDEKDKIYVADSYNNRVQIFQYLR